MSMLARLVAWAAPLVLLIARLASAGDAAAVRALSELATHEVVWNSPGLNASGSMPIGNGALGGNVWVDERGELLLLLSHTDSFSEIERLLKLGRVRVAFDPPLDLSRYSQRLSLADGAVEIEAGAGNGAATLRIFVDAESPVVHVTIDGATPRHIRATLENWRSEERRIEGKELASSWLMRDAPASVVVKESADAVVPSAELPGKDAAGVTWYHRNEWSAVPFTLEHQGLSGVAARFGDPLIRRTFGGRIDGEGFVREHGDASTSVATTAPQPSAELRITALCAQSDSVAEWLQRLEATARAAPRAEAARTRTARWWRERFSRSWLFVDAPTPSVLQNRHPLRIGHDSNGGNRFDGAMAVLRFHAGALDPARIEALANSGPDGAAAGTIVATAFTDSPAAIVTVELDDALARSASFTIEGWIAPARPDVTGRIADKITAGGTDGFLFDLQAGALRGIVAGTTLQSTARPQPGTPSHVALVYDAAAGTVSLAANGAIVASSPIQRARPPVSVSQAYATQRFATLAATRGEFPVKFNGSIFTVEPKWINGAPFNPDFRNWGGDYWWQNTRLPYHGMLARGDGDHLHSLFAFYAKAVAGCAARAKLYYNAEGAYFPETMTTFATYGNGDYGWNRAGAAIGDVHCPWWQWAWNQGPELVAMMLDHFDHTGDKTLLREQTLPVARAVLAYFDSRFTRDGHGLLQISPTQSLETYWHDVVNDLPTVAGLREVTDRLCALPPEFGESVDRALWERLRAACPPLPLEQDPATGAMKLSPAEKYRPQRSNCESPELYAVWPFQLSGVGRGLLEEGRLAFATRRDRFTNGWPQDGMDAARLGLADEAAVNLLAKVGNTHANFRFPTFWGPNFDWVPDQCHGGNLLTTVQEMVLQPVGRKILLLPAWPKGWNARFRLHAPGQTVVTGEVKGGTIVSLDVQPPERRADIVLGDGWSLASDGGTGGTGGAGAAGGR